VAGTGLYAVKAVPTKFDRTQDGAPVGQVITLTTGGLGTADAFKGGYVENVTRAEERAIVSHTDDTVTLEGSLAAWADTDDLDVYDSWDVIQDALDQLFVDQSTSAFDAIQYVRVFAGTYDENVTPNAGLNPRESDGETLVIEGDPSDDRANIIVQPTAGANAFLVDCDMAVLRHMTIDGGSASADAVRATSGCVQLQVVDCHISDAASGAFAARASNDMLVQDCVVDTSGGGLRAAETAGALKAERCIITRITGARLDEGVYHEYGGQILSCVIDNFAIGVRDQRSARGVQEVIQCTIYDCTRAVRCVQSGQSRTSFVNNVFDNVDYVLQVSAWPDEAGEGQLGAHTLFRNNVWRSDLAFAYDGTDTRTWTQFAAMDLVDEAGNLSETDPQLTDPDNGDYSLESDSPCRGTGAGSGVFDDYLGVAFDANRPDIGAWSGETTITTPVWPSSLPQQVDQATYAEDLANVVERSEMDTGPAKVRRRFTAGIQPMQATVTVTIAQAATLETFFDDTLEGGSLEFQWVHPRTQATARIRFVVPPTLTPRGPNYFVASLALEVLP
jgi:hypothetical protein